MSKSEFFAELEIYKRIGRHPRLVNLIGLLSEDFYIRIARRNAAPTPAFGRHRILCQRGSEALSSFMSTIRLWSSCHVPIILLILVNETGVQHPRNGRHPLYPEGQRGLDSFAEAVLKAILADLPRHGKYFSINFLNFTFRNIWPVSKSSTMTLLRGTFFWRPKTRWKSGISGWAATKKTRKSSLGKTYWLVSTKFSSFLVDFRIRWFAPEVLQQENTSLKSDV